MSGTDLTEEVRVYLISAKIGASHAEMGVRTKEVGRSLE